MGDRVRLFLGDCREVMATMDAESIDAVVSDPPYGLVANKKGGSGVASINLDSPYGRARIGTGEGQGGFMGQKWDRGVPGAEFWAEALRVAKPGAHLLAFGGTRTFHRLACAIEDAGWEIRDCVMWVYGSGFPKSLDVSKAIDKAAGAEREVIGYDASRARPNRLYEGGALGNIGGTGKASDRTDNGATLTAPATEAARRWEGWGTALKPAWEPIIVARKPFAGTVAANVLAHGTGAFNVDGCRVREEDAAVRAALMARASGDDADRAAAMLAENVLRAGRWPANLIHDGSEEVLAGFPVTVSGRLEPHHKRGENQNVYGTSNGAAPSQAFGGDTGSAARFFYCAKASKADRDAGLGDLPEATPGQRSGRVDGSAGINPYAGTRGPARNIHPTVKPTDLMRYLCRLVTPPGGVVLDPFMGSGSTGRGAVLEGFRFVGIDLTPEYVEIARRRIADAERERDAKTGVTRGRAGGLGPDADPARADDGGGE